MSKSKTSKKIIRKRDINKFMVDRIAFNIQILVVDSEGILKDGFKFNRGKFFLSNCKKREDSLWIRFQYEDNGNRRLRYYLKNKYNLIRTGSRAHHKDNFIPYNYRKKIKTVGLSLKKARKKALKIVNKNLQIYIRDVKRELIERGIPKNNIEKPLRSIKAVEINIDIETANGYFLVNSKSLKNALNTTVKEFSQGDYVDDKGNMALVSLKDNNGMEGRSITGHYNDGSKIKVYGKEASTSVVLNRIEVSYQGYKQLKKVINSTQIRSPAELVTSVNNIGKYVTQRLYCSLNSVRIRTPTQNKIIKTLCREHFKENYEIVYHLLTTGPRCVSTSTKTTNVLPNKVKSKIRALASEKIFLKKIDTALYSIDLRYIQKINLKPSLN